MRNLAVLFRFTRSAAVPILLAVLSVSAARAQSANGLANGNGTAAKPDPGSNSDWSSVRDAFSKAAQSDSSGDKRGAALARADLAKQFYTRHSADPRATQAKKLEIMALLDADAGDRSSATAKLVIKRLGDAVHAFRTDASIQAADRSQVAGFNDFHAASINATSFDGMHEAMANAARGLIREFPDQPQGYRSLCVLAGNSDSDAAREMAAELYTGGAPLDVQRHARYLLARLGLEGTLLQNLVPLTEAERAGAAAGKSIVLYMWSVGAPQSLTVAQSLASRATDKVVWIGLNLDSATSAAQAQAISSRDNYPGRQIFDDSGPNGVVALKLWADASPVVIIADPSGKIRDVQGLAHMDEKFSKLGL